jgi:hypothetical protein
MNSNIKEAIKFAGDVSLRKIEIVGSNNFAVDISKQIAQINVYEDLFSPFITMSIVVRESVDFVSALPLRGEEYINVEIATPSFTEQEQIIKGRFYVYKLSDRTEVGKKSIVYVLHCISYEAITDMNIKSSKAYRGKPSEIAKELIAQFASTKKTNIEEASNSVKYISNYWSPVKNLNYVASLAINSNKSPTYLFFENRYGFNFLSLESLYDSDLAQSFVKDDYSRGVDGRGRSFKNIDEDYKRILDIKIKSVYDSMENIPNGTYASRMISFDFLKKKYNVKDYNVLDKYTTQKHLNKNSLISEYKPASPVNAIYNQTKHFAMFDGFTDTSASRYLQERTSLIQLLQSNVVEITVLGRTDYTVGQKVYLKIPKATPLAEKDSTDDAIDPTYTGYYIITAMNHNIDREKHEITMELSKDSYIGK